MACLPEENSSNWVFACSLLEDIPVPGPDILPLDSNFPWTETLDALSPPYLSCDKYFENPDRMKEFCAKKRMRLGACGVPDSKAYKEKMRRDKLNDRFVELSCILEPGKPPKTDKAAILNDAVNMVIQLREEAQKLKESYNELHEKVKELKAEKTEMKDEKLKLKADKVKLEQRVKEMNSTRGFMPHLPRILPPFAAPSQVMGNKLVPLVGYPGIPMWQLMPPTAFDTSEDHALRPPVA